MREKILLIKPPTNFIPISWGYVIATLDDAEIPYDFWDTTRPAQPDDYYTERLKRGEYLAAATGGFVYSINWFVDLIRKLKGLAPQTPVILGGNITRNLRLDLMFQHMPLDFAVIGEAETSFQHLLQALAAGSSFDELPGVAFNRPGEGVVRNTPMRFQLEDRFWMPSYKPIDLKYYLDEYRHHLVPGLGRLMPILTGRGCKGGCSFCSPTVGSFKPRKVEDILRELEIYNYAYDFESISFATEIFFNAPEDIEHFCREYVRFKPRKPWMCCFRMDQPAELLKLMKESGCVAVNVGLESASQPVLSKLKKGCTVEAFKHVYDAARAVGLVVDAPFMMTNEDETAEDLKKTFDFVIEHKIDGNFGLVGTYPGTAIYHRAVKKGLIADEWDYVVNTMREVPWTSHSVMDIPYLNISAMNREEMYRTVFEQARRYLTFLFNEFQAANVALTEIHGPAGSVPAMRGECLKCGRPETLPITHSAAVHVIEYKFICHECHQKNFMHFIHLPQTRAYYEKLAADLRSAGRLLIVGAGVNAQDFLLYDVFGLSFDQLAGVIDWPGVQGQRHFFWLPLYHPADFDEIEYDAIVLADMTPESAHPLLEMNARSGGKPVFELAPFR